MSAVETRPATILLSELEQTRHVKLVRTAVANWPLVSIGAFIDQAPNDDELNAVGRLHDRAFNDALALLSTWKGHRNEAARLRALHVALDGTDRSLLEAYTSALLALGISYGLRLGGAR